MLQQRFGVSATTIVSRWSVSTVRPNDLIRRFPATRTVELRAWLRRSRVSDRGGVGGAPRPQLRRAGRNVNNKRVQRLWREEGLKVPYRKRKKPHRGIGTAVGAMCPIAPNALWALDFLFDTTVDGRTLKLLNIVDEFTRECPAIVVGRCMRRGQGRRDPRPARRRRAARPRSCGSTTGRSSSHARSRTGAASTVSIPFSSIPVHRGRTRGSRASTAGSATSSSTAGTSTTCSKLKSSSRTGASTTTPTDRTAPTATSPQPSSPTNGSPETNQHPHNSWTTQRGPLTGGGSAQPMFDRPRVCRAAACELLPCSPLVLPTGHAESELRPDGEGIFLGSGARRRAATVYLRFYLRNVARRSETTAPKALAKRLVGGGA